MTNHSQSISISSRGLNFSQFLQESYPSTMLAAAADPSADLLIKLEPVVFKLDRGYKKLLMQLEVAV